MSEDKKTIGLTAEGREALQHLMGLQWFRNELDAAMLAMAIEAHSGTVPEPTEGTDTKWNVGSLDPDARGVMLSLYPDHPHPYRAVESLMNMGLIRLSRSVRVDGGEALELLLQRAP